MFNASRTSAEDKFFVEPEGFKRPSNLSVNRYLPKGFEDLYRVKTLRRILANGLSRINQAELLPQRCKNSNRCESGHCPVCCRLTRKKLMNFLGGENCFDLEWHFVTLNLPKWNVEAGDFRSFAEIQGINGLTDIPELKLVIGRLRRLSAKPENRSSLSAKLIAIAAVETVYKTVANLPAGKPFHLHFAITGLTREAVEKAFDIGLPKSVETADGSRLIPLKFQTARQRDEVIKAVSYVVKQPFWKSAYINSSSKEGRPQSPTASEIAELACNFGPLRCTDRFIFIGFEFRGAEFRWSNRKQNKTDITENSSKNHQTGSGTLKTGVA